jgi:hypothetical protein
VFIDCRTVEDKRNYIVYERQEENMDIQKKIIIRHFVSDKAVYYLEVREDKWENRSSACCRIR